MYKSNPNADEGEGVKKSEKFADIIAGSSQRVNSAAAISSLMEEMMGTESEVSDAAIEAAWMLDDDGLRSSNFTHGRPDGRTARKDLTATGKRLTDVKLQTRQFSYESPPFPFWTETAMTRATATRAAWQAERDRVAMRRFEFWTDEAKYARDSCGGRSVFRSRAIFGSGAKAARRRKVTQTTSTSADNPESERSLGLRRQRSSFMHD